MTMFVTGQMYHRESNEFVLSPDYCKGVLTNIDSNVL